MISSIFNFQISLAKESDISILYKLESDSFPADEAASEGLIDYYFWFWLSNMYFISDHY